MNARNLLATFITFALVAAVAFMAGWRRGARQERDRIASAPADTVTVCDTIRPPVPEPVRITEIRKVEVPVTDTVRVSDTVYVSLPIVQKVYADSSYTAYVSGYLPQLDSIEVYSRTTTVTQRVPVPVKDGRRWTVGVQAGYGLAIQGGAAHPAPYVGVGIGYAFARF